MLGIVASSRDKEKIQEESSWRQDRPVLPTEMTMFMVRCAPGHGGLTERRNVGVCPNVGLAQSIGLDMGRFGIKVYEFQETSDPDILAGGVCVEKINFLNGKQLFSHSYQMPGIDIAKASLH